MQNKKRHVIALSYDYNGWIIERFVNHIRDLNKDKYDFILFSVHDMLRRPEFYRRLFLHVDLILNMLPSIILDIKKLTSKPVINTVHHYVDADIIRPFVNASEYIITVSDQWRDNIISDFNYPKNNISTIHCGIESEMLKNHKPLFPKIPGLINIGFFAKYTSNENDRKGVRHFKRLISYMQKQNILGNYRFIISGAGWDEFVSQSQKAGANIIYNKYIPDEDMPALYASLDFYLMLSDTEGGPATVLESMAKRVPCLSNNIGLVRDICHDGKDIILINPKMPSQICKKIQFYTDNISERDNIINNGYEIASHMTYGEVFKSYREVLDKFCDKIKNTSYGELDIKNLNKYLHSCAPLPY